MNVTKFKRPKRNNDGCHPRESVENYSEEGEPKRIERLGNGQIVALGNIKLCHSSIYRKAKFNCFESFTLSDSSSNLGKIVQTSSTQYRLIFSTHWLSPDDMDSLYLGATLHDVCVVISENIYYVTSFKKLENIQTATITHSSFFNINYAAIDNNYFNLLQRLPKEIRQLHQYYSQYEYAFLFSLAYVFENHIAKSGSFFRLKLAIMLSLVSHSEEPKNISSLLVICDDDLVIDRLLYWACLLTKNHFAHSSLLHSMVGHSISFSSLEQQPQQPQSLSQSSKEQWSNTFVNSGTLNLAADGIHLITSTVNLNSLPSKEKTYLEHSLESNEIIASNLKTTNINIEESKLKAVIWACVPRASSGASSKQESQPRLPELTSQSTGRQSSTGRPRWIDLFGLICLVPDAGLYLPDEEATLSMSDWRAYFDICVGLNPVPTEESEYIIKAYFDLNQRCQPHSKAVRSMGQARLLAKCVARLNLHSQVIAADAALAVMLYEEQLAALYPGTMMPIAFSFCDITHVTEESGQNMVNLLDDSYIKAFRQALIEQFTNQSHTMSESSVNGDDGNQSEHSFD